MVSVNAHNAELLYVSDNRCVPEVGRDGRVVAGQGRGSQRYYRLERAMAFERPERVTTMEEASALRRVSGMVLVPMCALDKIDCWGVCPGVE